MFGVVYLWVKHKLRRVSQVKTVEVWSGEVRKKKKKHDNHRPQPPEGQRSSPDVFSFSFAQCLLQPIQGQTPRMGGGGDVELEGISGGEWGGKPTYFPLQITTLTSLSAPPSCEIWKMFLPWFWAIGRCSAYLCKGEKIGTR